MENRDKIIEDAKHQVDEMEKLADNFSKFVGDMAKNLSKEDRAKLDKELKTIDISDVSKMVSDVNKDIANFRAKYNH
jgi:hypothetical protein